MKQRTLLLLFLLSISLHGYGQRKQGQARIDSLLAVLPKLKDDTTKVNIFNNISYTYQRINADEGLKYAEKSLALSENLKWKKGAAGAYNNFGVNYMSKSDYPNALSYYFRSLKLFEDLHDNKWIGMLYGNIGLLYNLKKNHPTALEYLFKSLKIAEQIKDTTSIELALGNISIIYNEDGKNDTALQYLLRALPMAIAGTDKGHLASVYGNAGNTYASLKNYHKALENSSKALKIAEEQNFKQTVAINSGNMGEQYLSIAQEGKYNDPDSLVPMGKEANIKKAIAFLTRSINICNEISYKGPIQEFAPKLADAYVMEGDYKAALNAYKQYTAVKDTIYNIANNAKIANLETERAVQLKDKDIYIAKLEIMKKRNERGFFIAGLVLMLGIIIIIFRNYKRQKHTNDLLVVEKEKVEQRTVALNATNVALTATLTNLKETQQQLIFTENQKENGLIRSRIAMDIHDDISSELTRMSWLSELVKLKFKKSDVAEVALLLDKITSASRQTIGNLQEIIWTVKPENDNVEELMAHIRNHVAKFFTDTAFGYTIDFPELLPSMHINPELKRNLFLVVKEALNNVAKYSQASHVVVSLRLGGDSHYMLAVLDDGKGIDKNVVEGGGNGLKNMQNRMADINGTCTIQSQPGQGTRIVFEGTFY